MSKFVFSGSPHIKSERTTKGIMIDVSIALLPAAVVGIVFFGFRALLVMMIAVVASIASELAYKMLFQKMPFKQAREEFDYTSLVTGLLIGMNMPPLVDWYIPVIASVFAIMVVKMLFGGTGKNIVNPAIAGRVFVFISFGIVAANGFINPINYGGGGGFFGNVVTAGATHLGSMLDTGVFMNSNLELFLGNVAGCIGETSAAALLAGGVYLSVRKVIDFRWPLLYIVVTGLMAVALKNFNFAWFLPSILSGGLMMGAIFMATDYTTTPNTTTGNLIYFLMLGVITAVLRDQNKTEVVSFVILLMNLLVPLFDKYIVPKPFGYVAVKKAKEAKQ